MLLLLNARLNSPPVRLLADGAGETGLPPTSCGVAVSECPDELELEFAESASSLGVEIGVRLCLGIASRPIVGDGGSWAGGGGMANGDGPIDDDELVDGMTEDIFKLIGAINLSLENEAEVDMPVETSVPEILSRTFSLIIPQCLNNHPRTL